MALWMKKRMAESQRKNGLNDIAPASSTSIVRPVELQFNYNLQSLPSTTIMKNEMDCLSMPNKKNHQHYQQQQQQHSPINLEVIQDSIEAKKELKHQQPTKVPQSTIENCNIPGWTVLNDSTNNNKSFSVTADRGDSNVMTLPPGAYYDEPVYIDPMTYQQQDNSISTASNVAQQNTNLAQSYRCANADCVNCKGSMTTK